MRTFKKWQHVLFSSSCHYLYWLRLLCNHTIRTTIINVAYRVNWIFTYLHKQCFTFCISICNSKMRRARTVDPTICTTLCQYIIMLRSKIAFNVTIIFSYVSFNYKFSLLICYFKESGWFRELLHKKKLCKLLDHIGASPFDSFHLSSHF